MYMKFVRKIPPANKKLTDELISDGWIKVKEPKNIWSAILTSIPLMIINGLITILIISLFYRPWMSISDNHSFSIIINMFDIIFFIISAFTLIIVHELFHAIFIPNFLKSDKIMFGVTLYGGFVTTTEKIKKSRLIIVSIAPFVLLSIILPIVLGTFKALNGFIVFLIIANAMGSSVDILNLVIILFQVPKNSYIIGNGLESYFK